MNVVVLVARDITVHPREIADCYPRKKGIFG
jgi:hypothetical protein